MTDPTASDEEPTDLRMARIELRHLRAEVARLRPFVAVADGASRAAEHWEAETKRWLEFIERGMDTHMQFSVIKPDGSTEQLPCADWCNACRIEKAESAIERVRQLAAAIQVEGADGKPSDADTLWPSEVLTALDQPKEQ